MEIGRLEFYATKRDKYGRYFGKIYPCSEAVRSNYNDGLVFFHESRIPRTSALRTDSRYEGYRYETRSRGIPGIYGMHARKIYRDPVYVAFDVPESTETGRGDAAITVMLLGEADFDSLPDFASVTDVGVKEALISAFPRQLALPRIGLEILGAPDYGDRVKLLKSCWDLSQADERVEFLESLDSEKLAAFITSLIDIDRDGGLRLKAPNRVRQALAARADAALQPAIAPILMPAHWTDELLSLMGNAADRRAFLARTNQDFHVHAITKYIESEGRLDDGDAADLAIAIRECGNEGISSICLSAALNNQPDLALRSDIGTLLTPALWSDGLLELMKTEGDMRAFLECPPPDFRAYAIARLAEKGERLDGYAIDAFASAVHDSDDEDLAAECVREVLTKQPDLALNSDLAMLLAPEMWVDELLEIMKAPEAQKTIFTSSRPAFRALVVGKLVDDGVPLGDEVFAMCPLRSCPNLLSLVQWSRDDAPYTDMIGRWLDEARLCDAEGRRLVVAAADQMHSTHELLSPAMWDHLPAAMRVRLCIFWSNHYTDLDDYAVRGGIAKLCFSAYKSQWDGYDQTLKAAMLFLALPLAKDVKKAFLDANDALIGEIVRQFNECESDRLQSFVLDTELQSLLQRCTAYRYADKESVKGFCDGREWRRAVLRRTDKRTRYDLYDDQEQRFEVSVWCHKGPDRPGGGRRECSSLTSPINADNTNNATSSNLENQFMADLLANANAAIGGNIDVGPWLDSEKKLDIVEYAYRVSAYVNKMSAALPHMVGRGCGARLRLNYEYPRKSLYESGSSRNLNLPALPATVCSCPNSGDTSIRHDVNVYIHYCLNCHKIIDSRECRRRDGEGYYLCMYCGASKVFKPTTACPSCGNTNQRTLKFYAGSMREELDYRSGKARFGDVLVACKAAGCMYDARDFQSEFESEHE